MSLVDLHLHSTASDGWLSPTEVVETASRLGLAVVALTDHDTTAGVSEAQTAGSRVGVTVIPAVEINTTLDREEIHILGYYLDISLAWLQKYFAFARVHREARARKITDNVRRLHGIPIHYADIEASAGSGVITRGHINKRLVQLGAAGTMVEADRRFTGAHCPAYVERSTATPKQAIAMIQRAGGVAVVAHPGRIERQEILAQILDCGPDGLEAYYFLHTPDQTKHYLKLAERRGLLVTGGSDCHGFRDSRSGRLRLGSVDVPWNVVEALQAKRNL